MWRIEYAGTRLATSMELSWQARVFVEDWRRHLRWQMNAYCLMRNHFHMICGDPQRGRFLPAAKRFLVPEPTGEANRFERRHLMPKMLQKALYVGFLG
jgi:hypothetical protein